MEIEMNQIETEDYKQAYKKISKYIRNYIKKYDCIRYFTQTGERENGNYFQISVVVPEEGKKSFYTKKGWIKSICKKLKERLQEYPIVLGYYIESGDVPAKGFNLRMIIKNEVSE